MHPSPVLILQDYQTRCCEHSVDSLLDQRESLTRGYLKGKAEVSRLVIPSQLGIRGTPQQEGIVEKHTASGTHHDKVEKEFVGSSNEGGWKIRKVRGDLNWVNMLIIV